MSANLEVCLRQLAEMSEECYRTSRDMMTQKNRVVRLEKDIENLNNAILEKKAEFLTRLENSEIVRNLWQQNRELVDELDKQKR